MGSKPITSRSKSSPLRSGGDKVKDGNTPPTLGDMNVKDANGNLVKASDNATSGTPGQPAKTEVVVEDYSKEWDKEAAGGLTYAEWKAIPGNAEKEQEFVKSRTKTITTGGTEGTDGERTTQYEPVLTEARDADKVDVFLPWERRFAQRTQRGAVRDEIKRGKKGMRQLDRALKAGVITQEQYDKDYANAQKLAYGQGVIAKGQYTNTEAMDAIVSQGYQANPAVSTQTDMLRRPQAEQAGGQPVKADASVTMSQEEYENYGKSTTGNSTPKTSAAVQDASKKAGDSVPAPKTSDASIIKIDNTSPSTDMLSGIESEDIGLMSDGPSQRTPQRKQSTDMFKQADDVFGDGVDVTAAKGPIGGKGVEKDVMAGITDPAADLPMMNDSYGVNIDDVVKSDMDMANDMLENDLANSAFKMKYKHSPAMMYKPSPTKMWGPSKQSNAGKSTGAQNIDKSTPGRPVTQNVTRSAKGIVTGKLSQSSAFKMKGFGNGKK